ncbi:unnamed protein product [Amoebophrya sp. A120]|nr:unnamed protein product [Amoebophrya sp. A120]|eukprot:GSA120T00001818001.1
MAHVLSGLPRKVCITGARGLVRKGGGAGNSGSVTKPKHLIQSVLQDALVTDTKGLLRLSDLDGLVAVPSLTDPHFMEAHYQATCLGLFPAEKPLRVRTIDTGGAGPVSALLEAAQMIECENCEVVAVVAGDCVGSLSSAEFLRRADASCQNLEHPMPSPVIPHGYDRYTSHLLNQGHCTRDQLRLVPVLESWHSSSFAATADRSSSSSSYTPLTKKPLSLAQVREAEPVTENISLLECARRADGAAAIVLASNRFLLRRLQERDGAYDESWLSKLPVVLGGAEASGPLYPPPLEEVTGAHFSSGEAACRFAYEEACLAPEDIDFFGLYDCFPVCFLKALEAAGVAPAGKAGDLLQGLHDEFAPVLFSAEHHSLPQLHGEGRSLADIDPAAYRRFLEKFPINTHGGLLAFGAPWEVPAAFNVVEAVRHLRQAAMATTSSGVPASSVRNCRRALVYGNGGIFSASAVAILGVR